MEPRYWWLESDPNSGPVYHCTLCFRGCRFRPGEMGYCQVRGADEGGFISPYLGRFVSLAVDPIEKKPLNHWRPGSMILSLGSVGCTMRCPFCQNHVIAQPEPQARLKVVSLAVDELVVKVKELGLAAVAYTYNEPTLAAEYILAAAPVLNEAKVATVMVTNGLFSPQLTEDLSPWLAAANVDVKTFDEGAYRRLGGSLEVVKRNVARLIEAGVHVELTTLVVPGVSDNEDGFSEVVAWAASLSPEIPFHLSRYFPAHKYAAPPTEASLMRRFQQIAQARLKHVYLGNMR